MTEAEAIETYTYLKVVCEQLGYELVVDSFGSGRFDIISTDQKHSFCKLADLDFFIRGVRSVVDEKGK